MNSFGIDLFLVVSIVSVVSLDIPIPKLDDVQNKQFTVKLMRTDCFTDSNNTVFHVCKAKLFRNKPNACDISFSLLKPVNSIYFWITLNYKYANYQPFMVDNKYDFCKLMKNERTAENVFAKFIIGFLKTQISWFHECPYQGMYNITNFKMVEGMLPPFLPAGDYRADFKFHDSEYFNFSLFVVHQFFTIRPFGMADLSMG